MNITRRFVLSLVLALLMGGLVTNAALAFHCTNPNIDGNAVLGEFNVETEQFTPYKENWGSFEEAKFHGAWVRLVAPSLGLAFNVFVHGVLPDGAMNSGPGDNLCDGKGIDDLDGCLAMFAP